MKVFHQFSYHKLKSKINVLEYESNKMGWSIGGKRA
jgi:hypothetical protein